MNYTRSITSWNVITKSSLGRLLFLFMLTFTADAAYANCPDPTEKVTLNKIAGGNSVDKYILKDNNDDEWVYWNDHTGSALKDPTSSTLPPLSSATIFEHRIICQYGADTYLSRFFDQYNTPKPLSDQGWGGDAKKLMCFTNNLSNRCSF